MPWAGLVRLQAPCWAADPGWSPCGTVLAFPSTSELACHGACLSVSLNTHHIVPGSEPGGSEKNRSICVEASETC